MRAVQEPFLPDGQVLSYLWAICENCGGSRLVSVDPLTEDEGERSEHDQRA
jgi:hypothetical protein